MPDLSGVNVTNGPDLSGVNVITGESTKRFPRISADVFFRTCVVMIFFQYFFISDVSNLLLLQIGTIKMIEGMIKWM